MRYWLYAEPVTAECTEPVWQVWSDTAILAHYWEQWCMLMKAAGREAQITENNCITDWAATHWAEPATPKNLRRIITAPKP